MANEVPIGILCRCPSLMTYACLPASRERQVIADASCHLSA